MKRQEALLKKHELGGIDTVPFLVCILPLNLQIDPESILSALENCDEGILVDKSCNNITYITIPKFKQRFSFIIPPIGYGNELSVLDYLKVCDTTLLLTTAISEEDDILDKWGHRIFNMISAQGIPSPIVALTDLESVQPKKRLSIKSAVQKFISKILPNEKLIQLGTNTDGLNLFRKIGNHKKNILHNKANRSHLFGEKIEFITKDENSDLGTLKITGFLRGNPLNVNGLVHISGLGDFQLNRIDLLNDPYKLEKNKNSNQSSSELIKKIIEADPLKQASLQRENIPDEMDTEQTWPSEKEIEMADEQMKAKMKLIKRVPKGMSNYQACWIPDIEEVEEDEDQSDETDTDDDVSENVSSL